MIAPVLVLHLQHNNYNAEASTFACRLCVFAFPLSVLLLISCYRNKPRANMPVNPRDVIRMDFGLLAIQ